MMKLSDNTMNMLKSFSSINSGIVFRKGNMLKIVSPEETIRVEVEITENFPSDFGIYDLPNLLSNLSILSSPEITITSQLDIKDSDGLEFRYGFVSEELIVHPTDELSLDDADVTFNVSEKILSKLLKIATMNSMQNLSISGVNGKIFAKVHDKNNDNSNEGKIELSDYVGDNFKMIFKTDLLKMLPMDYEVKIKLPGFALFENTAKKYKYFVGSEIDNG